MTSSSHHLSIGSVANLHAIPIELLEYIFIIYTREGAPHNPPLPYPAWLPITHVCHNWRTIALSYGPLWTSITRGLSLRWIKAFMERSRTLLVDINIRVYPSRPDTGTYLRREDIIPLLADFTRIRSLSLTGHPSTIPPIIDSLRSSLPIHCFSLCIEETGLNYGLPNDLFGGKAPIRSLKLVGQHQITAPHWLLRGFTHFTCSVIITVSGLLGALGNMPVLAYFEFQGHLNLNPGDYPLTSPIKMPQLMILTVRSYSPDDFIMLNQLLLLHVDAKRQMELSLKRFRDSFYDRFRIDNLLPVIEDAGGFQHAQLSGAQTEGWFRMWTGNAMTTWEAAKFCLHAEWRVHRDRGFIMGLRSFIKFCDKLGAARVRRLVIDACSPALQGSYWSIILHNLPRIEEVELSPTSVDLWKGVGAAAMLPGLQRVRIVDYRFDHYRPGVRFLLEEV